MAATVQRRCGAPDVLEPEDVEVPKPRVGDLLVHLHASAVNEAEPAVLGKRELGGGSRAPRR